MLVEVKNDTVVVEITVAVPQEDANWFVSRFNYTTLGLILKGHFILP